MTDPLRACGPRDAIDRLQGSRIRDVAAAGMGRPDVLPFWFGEPDEATDAALREVAIQSLREGQTFYTPNFGLPELREALADYVGGLHHFPCGAEQIAVTSGGVSALMLTMQALVDPGDRVVVLTPVWPNLVEIPRILGAEVQPLGLRFDAALGWRLDLDELLAALTPDTRLLVINSPNNPTGWVMPRAQQEAVLAHCRRHGIWVLSDEVYERYYFDGNCAPSFLDFADPQDRLVSCNSFSKAWRMTGWRLGWLLAPEALLPSIGKLIEFNTSCAPGFVQQAALQAVKTGEPEVARTVAKLRSARDFLAHALAELPGIETGPPAPGAMYAYFRIRDMQDSVAFCQKLVREGGMGLAPGAAFYTPEEGFVRWCFASSEDKLAEGVKRLGAFLKLAGAGA